MAWSVADIKYFARNPESIPAPGSYGEGQGENAYKILQDAKSAVQAGNMSVVDFQNVASTLGVYAAQKLGQISTQGSSAANAANPILQKLLNSGYVTNEGGKFVGGNPFSRQEYSELPDSVLPTQTDISNGVFDPTKVPIQRIQNPGGGSSTQPAVSQPITAAIGPNGQPLPGINPSLPPGTDTSTDQGKIALQGAQNAAALQNALNLQYGVNQQAVDQLQQGLQGIPDIFRTEGASQQQQLLDLANQQKSARAQALTDLASTLATNQQNLFNRAIPDLAEQANTKGIYRSTGFGDILANKYTNLTQDTQTQLALQGLSDRQAYLDAQSQALQQQLGWSGQAANAAANTASTVGSAKAGALQGYGAGLGDVANAQIGMQNAGLQRQFSLQDYAKQYQDALNLANSARTQGPTGKASQGTQAWLAPVYASAGQLGTAATMGKGGGAPKGYTPSPYAPTSISQLP